LFIKYIFILFPPFLITSCSYFSCGHSGDIEFQNIGAENIFVCHVEGFDSEPPVGWLITDSRKGSSMNCNNVPKEIRVEWYYESDTIKTNNDMFFDIPKEKVKYTTIDMSKTYKSHLSSGIVFSFNKNAQWDVSLGK